MSHALVNHGKLILLHELVKGSDGSLVGTSVRVVGRLKKLIQNEVILEMHGVELLVDIRQVGNLSIAKDCLLLLFIGELALRISDNPSSGYVLIARVGADVSTLDVHLYEKYAMQALRFSNP